MNIHFQDSPLAKKLVYIGQMFGPPNAPAKTLMRCAPLISDRFYFACQVKQILSGLDSTEHNNLFACLSHTSSDADIRDRFQSLEQQTLLNILDQITLPVGLHPSKEEILSASVNLNDALISQVFLNDIQQDITIILFDEYEQEKTSGTKISTSPCILGLGGAMKSAHAQDVILHEALHTICDSYIRPNENNFEEALLDYFAPNGYLSWKLGLENKFDIEACHRRAVQLRPYSKGESERLLPVMEKFFSQKEPHDIWAFLKENGLGRYLI